MTKDHIDSSLVVTVYLLDKPYTLGLTGNLPQEAEFARSCAHYLDQKLRWYRDNLPKPKEADRNVHFAALEISGELLMLQQRIKEYETIVSELTEQVKQITTVSFGTEPEDEPKP